MITSRRRPGFATTPPRSLTPSISSRCTLCARGSGAPSPRNSLPARRRLARWMRDLAPTAGMCARRARTHCRDRRLSTGARPSLADAARGCKERRSLVADERGNHRTRPGSARDRGHLRRRTPRRPRSIDDERRRGRDSLVSRAGSEALRNGRRASSRNRNRLRAGRLPRRAHGPLLREASAITYVTASCPPVLTSREDATS